MTKQKDKLCPICGQPIEIHDFFEDGEGSILTGKFKRGEQCYCVGTRREVYS